VTGAGGFVGRALVERLRASGTIVRGLVRTAREGIADDLVAADLTSMPIDERLLEGIDLVYHLAAKTHDLADAAGVEAEYERVNVDGTRRLLACIPEGAVRRVVYVSSVKAVDEGGTDRVDESVEAYPTTPYGRSKLAAERLVWRAAGERGFEPVCLRFPLLYGVGQRGNLQRMIAAIAHHRFPVPPANGNRRSMLHVGNAVDALVLAGLHPAAAGRVYTVTDARPYSTREIYDAIRAALGRRPARWSAPEWSFQMAAGAGDLARRAIGRRVGFDSEALHKLIGSAWYGGTRIFEELGYHPTRDLPATIPLLVNDVRQGRPRG
jgi:nucleoside-diphosphate-sugar epimerase